MVFPEGARIRVFGIFQMGGVGVLHAGTPVSTWSGFPTEIRWGAWSCLTVDYSGHVSHLHTANCNELFFVHMDLCTEISYHALVFLPCEMFPSLARGGVRVLRED